MNYFFSIRSASHIPYNLSLCAFTCALLQVLERIEDEVPDTPNERLKNLIDEAAALVVSYRRLEAAFK